MRCLLVVALLAVFCYAAPSNNFYATYWHNWASEDGETHFTLCNITSGWISSAFQPGQPPIGIRNLNNVTTKIAFFSTPYMWDPTIKFHTNPVVQLGIWYTGQMKFQSTDGTTVFISPGDLYLGDDVGSKGHHSQSVGFGTAMSVMVQFIEGAGKGPCWLK